MITSSAALRPKLTEEGQLELYCTLFSRAVVSLELISQEQIFLSSQGRLLEELVITRSDMKGSTVVGDGDN